MLISDMVYIFEYLDLVQEFNLLQIIVGKRLSTDLFIKSLLKKCFAKKRNSIREIDLADMNTQEVSHLKNLYYSIWNEQENYE